LKQEFATGPVGLNQSLEFAATFEPLACLFIGQIRTGKSALVNPR
jgi:hypothetical protein